jgi:hypothetical protein
MTTGGIEFFLAYWGNIRIFAILVSGLLAVMSAWMLVGRSLENDAKFKEGRFQDIQKMISKPIPGMFVLILISALLAALPSAKDLWEVRIAMLKWNLASPENIQKGVDHIDLIAKTLECRYTGINCPDEKKK